MIQKSYIKENKEFKYIDYENQSNEVSNNASYYIIDTLNPKLLEILSGVGGFCANVMKRQPKELGIYDKVKYIAFVSIPKETCDFEAYNIYLDKDFKFLHKFIGLETSDFSYFRKRFDFSIIEEGLVYELSSKPFFGEIKDKISENSNIFLGLSDYAKGIKLGDCLYFEGLELPCLNFKSDFLLKLKQNKTSTIIVEIPKTIDENLTIKLKKEDGTFLTQMEVNYPEISEEECMKIILAYKTERLEKEEDGNEEEIMKSVSAKIYHLKKPFKFNIPLSNCKNLIDDTSE